MSQILLGCDPEVFVKQGGLFRSAFGLIKGDKKNPQKVPRGAVQVDGMALEFNIDPAADEDTFSVNVQSVLAHMRGMVPDYEVVATPVAHFDEAYMKQQPEEALELGCDPDYNAWVGGANPRPDGNRPMRTASGHVHIGWTNGASGDDAAHQENCNKVVRNCDFVLGLPSLFYDGDVERREMYGKAGACRYKPYGVEYRTLSNAWLLNEARIRWVYRSTMKAMQLTMSGVNLSEKYGDIQAIINTSNKREATKIIKAEKLELCNG